jgi:hypothetical protein
MADHIEEDLVFLEKEHGIKIVLAMSGGDKRWGIDSPLSEALITFIYIRTSGGSGAKTIIYKGHASFYGYCMRGALLSLQQFDPEITAWMHSNKFYRRENVIYKFFVAFDTMKSAHDRMRILYQPRGPIADWHNEKLTTGDIRTIRRDLVEGICNDALYLTLAKCGTCHTEIGTVSQMLDDLKLPEKLDRGLREAIKHTREVHNTSVGELEAMTTSARELRARSLAAVSGCSDLDPPYFSKVELEALDVALYNSIYEKINSEALDAFLYGLIFPPVNDTTKKIT